MREALHWGGEPIYYHGTHIPSGRSITLAIGDGAKNSFIVKLYLYHYKENK